MATYYGVTSTSAATRTNTSLTVPASAPTNGISIISLYVETAVVPTFPTGYTAIVCIDYSARVAFHWVAWKRLGASEGGTTHTVTHTSTWADATMLVFQDCSTTAMPWAGATNQGVSANASATSVTPRGNNAAIAYLVTAFDAWTGTPPTGTTPTFTERDDANQNSYVATGTLATAGATGSKVVSDVSDDWTAVMVVIEDTAVAGNNPAVIADITTTALNSASATRVINLPATVNANDLLLLAVMSNQSRTITTPPSGWTNVFDTASTVGRLAVYAKIADGTEDGGTATIVYSGNTAAVGQVFRITNFRGDIATDIDIGTAVTTSAATFNAPPVTAGWGSAENLFLILAGTSDASAGASAAETVALYTDYQFANGTLVGSAIIAMLSWENTAGAATIDPNVSSTFTTGYDYVVLQHLVFRGADVSVFFVNAAGAWAAPAGVLTTAKTSLSALAGVAGAFAGTLTKRTSLNLSGVAGAVSGALVKQTNKLLAGTAGAMSATLATIVSKLVSVSGVAGAMSATLTKSTLKPLAGAAGAITGELTKRTNKPLAGTMGAVSGALTPVRSALVSLAGTMGAVSGALTKRTNKPLSGVAGAFSGTLGVRLNRVLAGTAGAFSGTLVKLTSKALAGAWAAPTGALTAIKSYLRAFDGTAGAFSGALTKRTNKPLAGAAGAFSGALATLRNKPLAGAWGAPTGALTRLRLKSLTGLAGAMSGSLVKRTNLLLSGSPASIAGALTKSTTKILAGTWGGAVGLLTSLFSQLVAGRGGIQPGSSGESAILPGSSSTIDATPPAGAAGNSPTAYPGQSHPTL